CARSSGGYFDVW
nr:immunoglobulin heavy chain junction region [Mus musculus]NSM05933.1 immunoglobulin heavy chain junction region [Mus musculus]NSM09743.1 immunoglobulin heavy chain junction region [Mus musculus]